MQLEYLINEWSREDWTLYDIESNGYKVGQLVKSKKDYKLDLFYKQFTFKLHEKTKVDNTVKYWISKYNLDTISYEKARQRGLTVKG